MREQEIIKSFKYVRLLKDCDNLVLHLAHVDNQKGLT